MTAEVAILNTSAVALAADSAVTVTGPEGRKILGNANKIFALSYDAPIGILVYGNANFMGIPMETMVKEYRKSRAGEKFSTISEYADSFSDFLMEASNRALSQQERFHLHIERIGAIFAAVRRQIIERVQAYVQELMTNMEPFDPQQIRSVWDYFAEQIIDRYHANVRNAMLIEGASNELLREARSELGELVAEMRRKSFGLSLSRSAVGKLNEVVRRSTGLMLDDVLAGPSASVTGIVIAGFGEEEIFPGYVEVHVDGSYGQVLRIRRGATGHISLENSAIVEPFAQRDMVQLFMQGLHPSYFAHVDSHVRGLVKGYSGIVLDRVPNLTGEERQSIEDSVDGDLGDIADMMIAKMQQHGKERIEARIVQVVRSLSKEQLGELADALVSLTSLRRQVSLDEETVGGPTDVAVITKGEGLVWIKRKHYFPQELNVSYLARVYGQAGRENNGGGSDEEGLGP